MGSVVSKVLCSVRLRQGLGNVVERLLSAFSIERGNAYLETSVDDLRMVVGEDVALLLLLLTLCCNMWV